MFCGGSRCNKNNVGFGYSCDWKFVHHSHIYIVQIYTCIKTIISYLSRHYMILLHTTAQWDRRLKCLSNQVWICYGPIISWMMKNKFRQGKCACTQEWTKERWITDFAWVRKLTSCINDLMVLYIYIYIYINCIIWLTRLIF